jgi:hypothetical protein
MERDLNGSSRTGQATELQACRPHGNAWLAECKTAPGKYTGPEKSGI